MAKVLDPDIIRQVANCSVFARLSLIACHHNNALLGPDIQRLAIEKLNGMFGIIPYQVVKTNPETDREIAWNSLLRSEDDLSVFILALIQLVGLKEIEIKDYFRLTKNLDLVLGELRCAKTSSDVEVTWMRIHL